MSIEKYVVLGYYNSKSNSYSLSCRRDIEGHPHFKRDGDWVVYSPQDAYIYKKFVVLFEGVEKEAKSFRDLLSLAYNGLNAEKLEMRQL